MPYIAVRIMPYAATFLAILFMPVFGQTPAVAQTCTAQDFATVMDRTGAELNAKTSGNARQIREKVRRLNAGNAAKPASDDGLHLSRTVRARVSRYNSQIDGLMSRMDRLGDLTLNPVVDCQRLSKLKLTASSLLNVLQQRFALIDKDLDRQLSPPKSVAATPAPKKPGPKPAQPEQWTTTTTTNRTPVPSTTDRPLANLPPIPRLPAPGEETFSIAEIKAAGRGFFGTISTSLANVINYTFQKVGRPTGYILGNEGGGAFIAGLRYGKGRLIMKRHLSQKVYWRGPSLGYDAGAEGSRTMFLIYNLPAPRKLFDRFSGGGGAAYLVGGVGITFLTNGKVVLAPIRSGLGLRLGASVGYLKFSPKPGWNPF